MFFIGVIAKFELSSESVWFVFLWRPIFPFLGGRNAAYIYSSILDLARKKNPRLSTRSANGPSVKTLQNIFTPNSKIIEVGDAAAAKEEEGEEKKRCAMDRLSTREWNKRGKRFVCLGAANSCNCSHVNIDTFPMAMTLTMTFVRDGDKLAALCASPPCGSRRKSRGKEGVRVDRFAPEPIAQKKKKLYFHVNDANGELTAEIRGDVYRLTTKGAIDRPYHHLKLLIIYNSYSLLGTECFSQPRRFIAKALRVRSSSDAMSGQCNISHQAFPVRK